MGSGSVAMSPATSQEGRWDKLDLSRPVPTCPGGSGMGHGGGTPPVGGVPPCPVLHPETTFLSRLSESHQETFASHCLNQQDPNKPAHRLI
jgi:hypothetical protein